MRVVRDVVIVTVFLSIGGFIVGFATQGMFTNESLAVACLLQGTLGFCLCGCLTIENRWKHLFVVALGVWLANMLWYLLPTEFDVLALVLSVFIVFVPMVVGSALSMLLVKTPKQKEEKAEQKQ
jgi:LytS/YehU family sensor histidine kinase